MIALRMLTSDELVTVGCPYLARIDKDEYRVVYPVTDSGQAALPSNICEFQCVTGEVFTSDAIAELAEIY